MHATLAAEFKTQVQPVALRDYAEDDPAGDRRSRRGAHRLHRSIHRVKPIHLNLASRPYRDYRPVYAVVVLMSLLIAAS